MALRIGSGMGAIPGDVSAMIQQAMDLATAAKADAAAAQATGANARQMVLNRDPQLQDLTTKQLTLDELATSYQTALAASTADRAGIHTQLTALATALSTKTSAVGTVAIPALLLGASSDVVIPLHRPMPSAVYDIAIIRPGALLANTTMTLKSQTATTVTVTVKATLAVTAGQAITVICTT